MNAQKSETGRPAISQIYRIGGAAALMLIVYTLVVMIILLTLGGPLGSAQEAFTLLQENKLVGILRLDAWTLTGMPLYYLFFAGICAALWRTHGAAAGLAAAFAFIGVTLFLATPSVTSMMYLGERYAAAATDAQRAVYLTAGETIIAADMWHATGPVAGGILMQGAGIWLSVLMLQGKNFGKVVPVIGMLTYGLDLAHIVFGFIWPPAGIIFMMISGPLYLVWFPLAGWRMLQLGRDKG